MSFVELQRCFVRHPGFVDVGVCRWQKYTGKVAVLAATGETFEQMEEVRQRPAVAA